MKLNRILLLPLLLISYSVVGQVNPPPYSAYTWSGTAWAAAASTGASQALTFQPPAIALYCFNSGTGKWVAADSSCFGGGGSITPSSVTSPNINNVRYLSCSSELGAQVATAVTSLGATGGQIIFPNCTNATWTTAAVVNQANISFKGYGTRASQITCSVAGNCLTIHEAVDWTTSSLAIGSEISGFTMLSTGAAGEKLISLEGANGFLIHDIGLNGAGTGAADGQTYCLEFHNTATDNTFTERNTTFNVALGQQCNIGVHFVRDAGDKSKFFWI